VPVPAKQGVVAIPVCFSDPAAIGLPSYAGSKTKEKNHQNADERQ